MLDECENLPSTQQLCKAGHEVKLYEYILTDMTEMELEVFFADVYGEEPKGSD